MSKEVRCLRHGLLYQRVADYAVTDGSEQSALLERIRSALTDKCDL